MTSQQKADEWLAIWRGLRAIGYAPPARDRIIENMYAEHHRQRLDRIVEELRAENPLPSVSVTQAAV